MINDKADEIIEKCFQSFLSRYQIGLETPIKGSDFIYLIVIICFVKNVIKKILNLVNHKWILLI